MKTESKPESKKSFVAAIILFVFSGLWLVGAIGWYFIYTPVSTNNTVEKTATVSSIKPIGIYKISTTEYQADLFIFWEETVLSVDALNSLSIGQAIAFRIKKSDENNLKKNEQVELVALKVDSQEIITLGSFNNHTQKMRLQACTGFVGASVLFSMIAMFTLLWSKGVIGKKAKKYPQI